MPRERNQGIHVAEGGVRVHKPTPSRPHYHRITWTDPATGKRKQAFERTAKQARKRANQIGARLARAEDHLRPAPMRRVIDEWLDPGAHSPRWSESYAERQASYANTWLRPVLEAYRSDQLTPAVAARVISAAVEAGQADTTVESIGAALRGLISWAQAERYVPTRPDPMAGVGYARKPSHAGESVHHVRSEEVPDTQAVWRLAEAMGDRSARLETLPGSTGDVVSPEGRWLQPLIAGYSRMRLGEQVALRASDVDLDRCLIRVERALSLTRRSGTQVVTPKHGKTRTTIFPDELRAPLARFLEHRTDRDGPEATLWVAPMGGWETRHSLRDRRFNPAARDAQWPVDAHGRWKWTWHALRHFFCVTALKPARDGGYGLTISDIAALAGHHSESFTAARYLGTQGHLHQRVSQAAKALQLPGG